MMPARRTRNCTSVVVRSRTVNETGSMSYLKKMPGAQVYDGQL